MGRLGPFCVLALACLSAVQAVSLQKSHKKSHHVGDEARFMQTRAKGKEGVKASWLPIQTWTLAIHDIPDGNSPEIPDNRLGEAERMLESPREIALQLTPDAKKHLQKDPSLQLQMQFIYPQAGYQPYGNNHSPVDMLQLHGGFRYFIDGYGVVADRSLEPIFPNVCPDNYVMYAEAYCPVTRFPQSIPHHAWQPIDLYGLQGLEFQWIGPSMKEKLFDEWNCQNNPLAINFLGAFVFRMAGQDEIEWRCQDMGYGFLKEKNLHVRLHEVTDYEEPEYINYDDDLDQSKSAKGKHGKHHKTKAQLQEEANARQLAALSKVFGALQLRSSFGYTTPSETFKDKMGQSIPGFAYSHLARMEYVFPKRGFQGKCHSIEKGGDKISVLLQKHKTNNRRHHRGLLAVLDAQDKVQSEMAAVAEELEMVRQTALESAMRADIELEYRKRHKKQMLDTVVEKPVTAADAKQCFNKNGAFVFKMNSGNTVAAAIEFAMDEDANLPLAFNQRSCPPCFTNENIPVSEGDWQSTETLDFAGEGVDFVYLPADAAVDTELFGACNKHDKRVRNFGGAFIFRKQSLFQENMRFNWRCLDNSFWTKSGNFGGGNLDFVDESEILKERKTSMVQEIVDSEDQLAAVISGAPPPPPPVPQQSSFDIVTTSNDATNEGDAFDW